MELFPAIDLRCGHVVRLLRGDDRSRTAYAEDPEAVLADYRQAGAAWVHVVDLDAALGEPAQRDLVERLAAAGAPALQLGGGLRDAETVAWALAAGCRRAVVGSMVARDPDLFAALAAEHPGRLVPALDTAGGELRVAGWREASPLPLSRVCRRLAGLPCPAVLVTDVERDGTLAGPNLELARRVGGAVGLPALVSGGVRTLADLEEAARCPEIGGAVVGRALYEGAFTAREALAACRGEMVP